MFHHPAFFPIRTAHQIEPLNIIRAALIFRTSQQDNGFVFAQTTDMVIAVNIAGAVKQASRVDGGGG